MNEQRESSRTWHKSSFSGSGADCVEVAVNLPGFIAVRDSKNADGPGLIFALGEWVRFMSQLKCTAELEMSGSSSS